MRWFRNLPLAAGTSWHLLGDLDGVILKPSVARDMDTCHRVRTGEPLS